MKKALLLVALLGSIGVANAESWSMNNRDGGKIVLTSDVCVYKGTTYKNLNNSYSYGSDSEVINGCWKMRDGNVFVLWSAPSTKDGYVERIYSPSSFSKVGA